MGFVDKYSEFKRKKKAWKLSGYCCPLCRRAEKGHRIPRCDRGKNPRRR